MKRFRFLIGILCIGIAAAGLVLWETKGRDAMLMEDVLVASQDIKVGTVLKESMLKAVKLPKDVLPARRISRMNISGAVGKTVQLPLQENQPITQVAFEKKKHKLKEGQSFYVINPEWIEMCSSAVRKNDRVQIMSSDGQMDFGVYSVAFVKNTDDGEIRDVDETGEYKRQANPDERTDATSPISHLEIVCADVDYFEMRAYATASEEASLVIILKEE